MGIHSYNSLFPFIKQNTKWFKLRILALSLELNIGLSGIFHKKQAQKPFIQHV